METKIHANHGKNIVTRKYRRFFQYSFKSGKKYVMHEQFKYSLQKILTRNTVYILLRTHLNLRAVAAMLRCIVTTKYEKKFTVRMSKDR